MCCTLNYSTIYIYHINFLTLWLHSNHFLDLFCSPHMQFSSSQKFQTNLALPHHLLITSLNSSAPQTFYLVIHFHSITQHLFNNPNTSSKNPNTQESIFHHCKEIKIKIKIPCGGEALLKIDFSSPKKILLFFSRT